MVSYEGRMQRDIDIGGLGVGRELLLGGRAGLPKPLCSQPLLWGGDGLVLGETAIERCWHRQDKPAVGRCSFCYPRALIPTLGTWKNDRRTSTALRDNFGKEKSPEIPSLSNGVDAPSSLLVVVGGIAFIGKREAFLGS